MPSPSNLAHRAAVRILAEYDDDPSGAAEALIAVLRSAPADDPAPGPDEPSEEAA